MGRTALIAGASGLVGGQCLRLLLESNRYQRVVALTRRVLPVAHAKLSGEVVDFVHLDKVEKADDVFCALGTTMRQAGSQEAFRNVDFDHSKRLAELALAAGAKRFVLVSAVGADPGSRSFYLRVKGELEAALSTLPFEALHIFRPSLLVGARTERRPGEALTIIAAQIVEFTLVGKMRRYRPIAAETVAAAMLAAVTRGGGLQIYEYDQIKALARDAEPPPLD